MINMRMTQHHGINRIYIEGKLELVAFFIFITALNHAAVEQNNFSIGMDFMT